LSSVAGWIITAHLDSKRDIQARRIELRVQHLSEDFTTLTEYSNLKTDEIHDEINRKMERMVIDLDVWGTPDEFDEIGKLAGCLSSKNPECDTAPLLRMIRDDVRSQLDEDKINGNPIWLKLGSK
jgi:hypothetical protein